MTRWMCASVAGLACAAMLVALSTTPAAGQGKPDSIPRDPFGRPDLQGVWSYATITPLERPDELAGKAVLTEEEAAEVERRTAQIQDRDRRDHANTRERGSDGRSDVDRAYNHFWWDFGTTLARNQTSLVVDPPDGRIPPLTPQAEQRQTARAEARRLITTDADNPEDRSLWERCITRQLPTLPGPYNNNVQIFQTRDHVVILQEMIHEARIIPTDGRPHDTFRQWHGDSRGRWEGDTLVVETINFTDKTNFRGSGENLKLTERYSRPDPDTLLYRVTIEDPTTWTKPWTVQVPMSKSDEPVFEYACHEANYGLEGILKGSRLQDKVGAGTKP
jgi:hypothetical protein